MVPVTGFEPVMQQILSLRCIPIPAIRATGCDIFDSTRASPHNHRQII